MYKKDEEWEAAKRTLIINVDKVAGADELVPSLGNFNLINF